MKSNFLRILLLLALLLVQVGCAETESDLNYQRDSPTPKQGDSSYHGWNEESN